MLNLLLVCIFKNIYNNVGVAAPRSLAKRAASNATSPTLPPQRPWHLQRPCHVTVPATATSLAPAMPNATLQILLQGHVTSNATSQILLQDHVTSNATSQILLQDHVTSNATSRNLLQGHVVDRRPRDDRFHLPIRINDPAYDW